VRQIAIILLLAWATLGSAQAVTPEEMLKDPGQEARARALSTGLRCMVCQNQSIDDSDADLAHDIRVLLRERIVAGDSDEAVMKFLVARYGDFILLKPPVNLETILLWAVPFATLLLGGVGIFIASRRNRVSAAPPITLSEDEQRQLQRLLAEDQPASGSPSR
jgi:cytochrome c-type biogenesis protein CcmH